MGTLGIEGLRDDICNKNREGQKVEKFPRKVESKNELYDNLMRAPICIKEEAYGIQTTIISTSSMCNARCAKHFLAMFELKQVTLVQAK